ncbi:hypothetical protein LIER_29899 [Lithospermum erythrorhizon]|uniref:Uncharacterized protein n=1 Tax=Lithospermum erythrorhizon TaxID=34254 RepID=A0AAV3RRM9_LITER
MFIDDDSTAEEVSAIHNNYLPWVDYTNVREIDNPKSDVGNSDDDDVGGEKSHVIIDEEESVEEEEVEPIVTEKVFDSSSAAVSEIASMLEPSIMPSVNDRSDMDGEPSIISKTGRDAAENNELDVEDVVPDIVEEPSTKDLGVREDLSVNDTLDRIAEDEDLLKTSDVNTSEGMYTNIPRVDEPTTEEAGDVAHQGHTKTLNEDIEVLVPSLEENKSKKRKLQKMSKVGPSEPKQKLTRE